MIVVRVEVFSLWHIDTEWWLIVITGQDVEDVVDSTRSESDFTQIDGPDTTIGVLTLYTMFKKMVMLNVSIPSCEK
jgi:hypothetical protein